MAMDAGTYDAVSQAISNTFAESARTMVTKWVLVAEVIDPDDGEPCVWTHTADQQSPWDSLGLLEYARQLVQAANVVDAIHDDEDGDQ